jgi:predicted KAP-like P-loop ATPase
MASSRQIAGNPRLIKRFLNTLSIRMAIARTQGVTVDEAVLAKMLLFERCGGDAAYAALVAEINDDSEGRPRSLRPLEEKALANEELDPLPDGWDAAFTQDWLAVPPALAGSDLRPVVHVSREHLPIITAADQLSSEAASLLAALVELTEPSVLLNARLTTLAKRERAMIMDHLLSRARQVQEWSRKEVAASLTLAKVDAEQGQRLAAFLREIPAAQLKAALVPTIQAEAWADGVFNEWNAAPDVPKPVKNAIANARKRLS